MPCRSSAVAMASTVRRSESGSCVGITRPPGDKPPLGQNFWPVNAGLPNCLARGGFGLPSHSRLDKNKGIARGSLTMKQQKEALYLSHMAQEVAECVRARLPEFEQHACRVYDLAGQLLFPASQAGR